MSDTAAEISADQLVATARAHGYRVSRTQLARWHRAGWLPRPHQRHLGRGQGTESVYPEVARRQLLAICAIPSRQRHSPQMEWRLWWAGYDIRLAPVRQMLERMAAWWAGAIPEWFEPGAGLTDAKLVEVEGLAKARRASRTLRRARQRVGRESIPTFVSRVAAVAAGRFKGWEDEDDQRIVDRGLGFPRARTDRRGGLRAGIPGNTAPQLEQLSQQFASWQPTRQLATATDSDLTKARDELRAFLTMMANLSPDGAHGPGVSTFAAALAEPAPGCQALWLLFWMALRSEELAGGQPALHPLVHPG